LICGRQPVYEGESERPTDPPFAALAYPAFPGTIGQARDVTINRGYDKSGHGSGQNPEASSRNKPEQSSHYATGDDHTVVFSDEIPQTAEQTIANTSSASHDDLLLFNPCAKCVGLEDPYPQRLFN
jgi:hypothetical protein